MRVMSMGLKMMEKIWRLIKMMMMYMERSLRRSQIIMGREIETRMIQMMRAKIKNRNINDSYII